MQKIINKKLNLKNNCIEEYQVTLLNYSYTKCIENFSIKTLLVRLKEKNIKLCWIPQADYLISQMNRPDIDACKTTKDMNDLVTELNYALDITPGRASECKELPIKLICYDMYLDSYIEDSLTTLMKHN